MILLNIANIANYKNPPIVRGFLQAHPEGIKRKHSNPLVFPQSQRKRAGANPQQSDSKSVARIVHPVYGGLLRLRGGKCGERCLLCPSCP